MKRLAVFICSLPVVLIRAAQIIDLPTISPSPKNASRILDRSLASLSIEFSYLPSFGGNLSSPNLLTKALMEQLLKRTGVGPDIRPGGITADSTQFNPNASALEFDESPSGGIWRTTYGPAYYESLSVFPISSKIVVDVNLGNNTVQFARDEIQAAVRYIGWDRIRALELGNEPDHFAGGSRPSTWASSDYTAQFLGWTSVLSRNLSLPHDIFQAGSFAEDPTSTAPMTTVSIIEEGVDSTGAIKIFSQHTYQYSTCDPARDAIATLPNLINHQNITAYLDLWKPQIAAAHAVGKEFVVGEYSSVSCSGKQNVTDTFGQALWLADTVLYGAFLNISRMYLHQGATLVLQSNQQANSPGFSWYDLWYPVETDRYGAARASPSFVAYLLITEAVGSSGKSQISLIPTPSHPQLAVYAIWDQSSLSRIAVLNLAIRNVTASDEEKEAAVVYINLSDYIEEGSTAKVKRMSAPGLDSKDSSAVTWAGQSYENGTASGVEVVETLEDGILSVQGSEGVLVFL
ncbi:glycoside hydrolase family 79 protein [Neolentinus lepideus HHB14362 ss-1]|uniref:Glycoside hydrolase family 79 protein n=1 Tax=Neolentinus lepideus HHB14362 ss-1 TaxID=1314782 RepID=A0A165VP56_9AGAM|nr:glycoside hydrolase family 79 protein [Neolentinus lepideus HHB14362 ss-1]